MSHGRPRGSYVCTYQPYYRGSSVDMYPHALRTLWLNSARRMSNAGDNPSRRKQDLTEHGHQPPTGSTSAAVPCPAVFCLKHASDACSISSVRLAGYFLPPLSLPILVDVVNVSRKKIRFLSPSAGVSAHQLPQHPRPCWMKQWCFSRRHRHTPHSAVAYCDAVEDQKRIISSSPLHSSSVPPPLHQSEGNPPRASSPPPR